MARPRTGSVRLLRTGVYEVRLPGQSRTVHGSKDDAEQVRRDLLSAMHRGEPIESGDTVGDLLDEWLEVKEGQLERTTIDRYKKDARLYLRPVIGKKQVRRLSVSETERLFAAMAKRGLSLATIKGAHAVLSGALAWALKDERLRRNVAALADLPDGQPHRVKAVEVADVLALIRAAEVTNGDLAVFVFLATTMSLRRGELCGLRWSDIDWERRTVAVCRAIADVKGGWYVKEPKNEESFRVVPLAGPVAELLTHHRGRMEARAQAARVTLLADGYVFSTEPDGSVPYRPKIVTNQFTRLRDDLELPHVHLHSLRHFNPTHLLADGEDARAMAEYLGHANQTTTLSIYTQYLPVKGRELAERAAALLSEREEAPQPVPKEG